MSIFYSDSVLTWLRCWGLCTIRRQGGSWMPGNDRLLWFYDSRDNCHKIKKCYFDFMMMVIFGNCPKMINCYDFTIMMTSENFMILLWLLCRGAICPGEAPYRRVKSVFLIDRLVTGGSARSSLSNGGTTGHLPFVASESYYVTHYSSNSEQCSSQICIDVYFGIFLFLFHDQFWPQQH